MPVVTTPEAHVTLFGESAAILKSFLAFRNTPFIAPIVGAKARRRSILRPTDDRLQKTMNQKHSPGTIDMATELVRLIKNESL